MPTRKRVMVDVGIRGAPPGALFTAERAKWLEAELLRNRMELTPESERLLGAALDFKPDKDSSRAAVFGVSGPLVGLETEASPWSRLKETVGLAPVGAASGLPPPPSLFSRPWFAGEA